MVIPSYWQRKKSEGWKKTDAVYDHPTPLDEEGTLGRILKSLSVLKNRDFSLVILGVSTASDIQEEVEAKIALILDQTPPPVKTFLFSYSRLEKLHKYLQQHAQERFVPLLKLDGYSNVRNLCLFLPHILGSDVAVLIDDDEIFEDDAFMGKALEFIGRKIDGETILAVAGYYINPDDDYYLHKDISPWMTYWNKIDCMNRGFRKIISSQPRLKETPFAFGGNLVIHRRLFTEVPFDPAITRGEDIDFLINARLSGYKIWLDNELSIKHAAPPKTHSQWCQLREDILRFVFEKRKLQAQRRNFPAEKVTAQDLDPYPGEFLKDDLEERIVRSNLMLAVEYLREKDPEGAAECMKNIFLAKAQENSAQDPIASFLDLQKKWKKMMEFFSDVKVAREVCEIIGFFR